MGPATMQPPSLVFCLWLAVNGFLPWLTWLVMLHRLYFDLFCRTHGYRLSILAIAFIMLLALDYDPASHLLCTGFVDRFPAHYHSYIIGFGEDVLPPITTVLLYLFSPNPISSILLVALHQHSFPLNSTEVTSFVKALLENTKHYLAEQTVTIMLGALVGIHLCLLGQLIWGAKRDIGEAAIADIMISYYEESDAGTVQSRGSGASELEEGDSETATHESEYSAEEYVEENVSLSEDQDEDDSNSERPDPDTNTAEDYHQLAQRLIESIDGIGRQTPVHASDEELCESLSPVKMQYHGSAHGL